MTFSMLLACCVVAGFAAEEASHQSVSIDSLLAIHYQNQGLEPAGICSDELFLRRVSLDLIGRIPRPEEVREFRRNPNRIQLVDRLLASDDFSGYFADQWTAWLIGYVAVNNTDRNVFRDWLEKKLRDERSFREIGHELVAAKGNSSYNGPVNFYTRHRGETPIQICRALLGVRLDCARCHDHPFDRWTQEDFALMRRFFSGINAQNVGGSIEIRDRTMNANEEVPRFLTGAEPKTGQWREELAMFVTHCKPFSRSFVNRIWYQLMGRGFVNPPDDFSGPAAVPDLLEFLAAEARKDDFDIRKMVREICISKAYQRDCEQEQGESKRVDVFAARCVKPLTVEQYINSLSIAVNRPIDGNKRRQLLGYFTVLSLDEDHNETWRYAETVSQLMRRLNLGFSPVDGDVEELYLRILSRGPSQRELEICRDKDPQDVLFALVNSNEFFFNH